MNLYNHFLLALLMPGLWLINSYIAYRYGRDEIYPMLKWSENEENAAASKFALFLMVEAIFLHFVLCFSEYVGRKIINYSRRRNIDRPNIDRFWDFSRNF